MSCTCTRTEHAYGCTEIWRSGHTGNDKLSQDKPAKLLDPQISLNFNEMSFLGFSRTSTLQCARPPASSLGRILKTCDRSQRNAANICKKTSLRDRAPLCDQTNQCAARVLRRTDFRQPRFFCFWLPDLGMWVQGSLDGMHFDRPLTKALRHEHTSTKEF